MITVSLIHIFSDLQRREPGRSCVHSLARTLTPFLRFRHVTHALERPGTPTMVMACVVGFR